MYVVLHGKSLVIKDKCKYMMFGPFINGIPLGEKQPWMSEAPELEDVKKKHRSPEIINFFLLCIKKMSCSSSRKGTPHDLCVVEQ